jgi:type I restriction enzyme S subunit
MKDEQAEPLPKGWKWTTLAEIADIKGGITKGQKRRASDAVRNTPYLRVANVQRGYLALDEVKEIEATEEEIAELRLSPGDVLFTEGGDRDKLGRGWVWRGEIEECIHQNHIFRARLRLPEIEPKLISWYGNTAGQEYFTRQGKQTTNLASINLAKLSAFPVPIPPANEQRRIVAEIEAHLTRLDAAVAALAQAKVRLKRYRAAILKAACDGRLVATEAELARAEGRDYEPADRLLARILQERRARWEAEQLDKMQAQGKSPRDARWKERYVEPVPPDPMGLSQSPEGWALASIDQLTTHITSGSRDWSQYYGEGTGTFLMAQNVRLGRLDLSFRQPVNPPEVDRDRVRSQVQHGDILVTIVGANTGNVCIVPLELPEHYVCQSVALMRPVLEGIADFTALYLASPENGQKQYARYIYGAGRPHLSFDQLKMTAVLLPPLAEQRRILAEVERRLSLIDDLEATVTANLRRADRLRQAILKRAFEGKLVPQDPADEPASVLLERIKASRAAGPDPMKGVDPYCTQAHHKSGGGTVTQATLFPDAGPPPRTRRRRRA